MDLQLNLAAPGDGDGAGLSAGRSRQMAPEEAAEGHPEVIVVL